MDGTTNNLVLYSTQYEMVHQKRGGTLRGLQIKREREEYVGILPGGTVDYPAPPRLIRPSFCLSVRLSVDTECTISLLAHELLSVRTFAIDFVQLFFCK